MINKEATELLEENVVFYDNEGSGRIAQLPRGDYDQLLALVKEQPPASEFTTLTRKHCSGKTYGISQSEVDWLFEQLSEACDRLDASEASRKELLAACEAAFNESHNPKVEKILESAIKANK